MATGRVPTTANSPLTAKGDLFGYSTAPARLAVGNNGESLVADSSTSTGLRYQGSMAAGKNTVINGGFDIWQRGTSLVNSTYLADRWLQYGNGGITTVSRQATGDTTNLPFIQYASRIQRTSGQTGTAATYYINTFETVNSVPLAGKTVTLSFYARRGANYSAASNALQVTLVSGTGTDQSVISGFSGYALPINSTATLTTTWQRFTYTATVASTATQLAVYFVYEPVGTAGANDYFEVTGVQLELGSVATAFSRNGATIQGELSAAQRYYYRANWDAKAAYPVFAQGGGYSTTSARLTMPLPVNMRVQPTAIDTSAVANMRVQSFNDGTSVAPSAITFDTNFTTTTTGFIAATVASGLTANALYYLRGEGSTAYYIGWSAEL